MITEQDIQALLPQYPSHAASAGIAPRDWAIDRLSRMPAPQPAAQPTQPAQPREWETRIDQFEGRLAVQQQHVQLTMAQEQAADARDEAELRPLVEQRDALNVRINVITARRQRRRFYSG